MAAVAFGAVYGIRQVWFLGTDDGGRVALYRGLPYDLPFGVSLYQERYASPIQTSSLPARQQGSVTGHDLRSRSDATSLIEDIERKAGLAPDGTTEVAQPEPRGQGAGGASGAGGQGGPKGGDSSGASGATQ